MSESLAAAPDEAANSAGAPSSREDGALGDAADNSCSAPSPVRNFTAILDDMNYRPVLDILGVGTFQFTRRKLLTREFRALYVGLWRLALMRSFPTRHAELFQAFMEGEAARCKDRRQAVAWAELVMQYAGKLSEHGDADFFRRRPPYSVPAGIRRDADQGPGSQAGPASAPHVHVLFRPPAVGSPVRPGNARHDLRIRLWTISPCRTTAI